MSQYDPLYEQAGEQYGVDPKLLKAVAETESGENPRAVSSQGARGITQFMPATAKAMGIDPNDPKQAIPATAKLLAHNFATYGDPDKAIMAYHGGTDPANWGPKTNAYLQKVSRAYGNMSDLQPQPHNSTPQGFDVAGGIAKARKAGYSDQEIMSYLAKNPDFQAGLEKAKTAGYSDADIYGHFGLKTATATQSESPEGGGITGLVAKGLGVQSPALAAANAKHPYSATDSLVNSMTFGLGNEASALGMAAGNFLHGNGFDFPESENTVAAQAAQYAQQNPGESLATNLGGIIFGAAPVAKGLKAAQTLGGLIKQGAQAGSVVGALTGLANGRGDLTNRLGTAAEGAVIGSATGGAVPIAFRGLGRLAPAAEEFFSPSASISPETAKLAQKSQELGVPLRLDQMSSSRPVKMAASVAEKLPFTGYGKDIAQQRDAFVRAVSNTFGEDATRLTQDVMAKAKARIGNDYNTVLNRTTLPMDDNLLSSLGDLQANASDALDEAGTKHVNKLLDGILSKAASGGGILTGRQYQSMVAKGGPIGAVINSKDSTEAFYGRQIKNILDDAFQKNASPEDAALFRHARTQYKNLKTVEDLAEKAPTGDISPALLLGQVRKSYPNLAYEGAGNIGDLARIGQAFIKDLPNSGTPERMFWHDAFSFPFGTAKAIGTGVSGGALGLARLAAKATGLSDRYKNRLISAALNRAAPSNFSNKEMLPTASVMAARALAPLLQGNQ